ncbi:hypothetical protein Nepgr_016570 [Nepenthes gracilis]|uniref:H(+)-exporting diphosphatase n=1 Tax=Nepenthes gracilis TaxID=150966 RepID=A0AAD3XS87_NEPGR|nr:hypothetical protein Nepgr_016570 [Nepenthes gracilis]
MLLGFVLLGCSLETTARMKASSAICVEQFGLLWPGKTLLADGKGLTGSGIVAKSMLTGSNSTITEIAQLVADAQAATLDFWNLRGIQLVPTVLLNKHAGLDGSHLSLSLNTNVILAIALSYHIVVAGLHLLGTIATINAHSSINESVGDIDEKVSMSRRIHERDDALDTAGNTSTSMGKGIANCIAALISLAFWGVFVGRASNPPIAVLIRDIQIFYFYHIWVLNFDNEEDGQCSPRDERRSPQANCHFIQIFPLFNLEDKVLVMERVMLHARIPKTLTMDNELLVFDVIF